MTAILDRLRGFFATSANWNVLTGAKRKFTFPPSIKIEEDPSETWEIVSDIGDGAFGKIFKAQNKESGVYSALKQVNVDDELDLGQYSVEVMILSELKHPNVVGMYDAFFYNSKFWMYLEYCAIGAVDNIIHDLEHGLSEPQIQSIAKQMCTGLSFLHDNGVIHRDLKAGNVLITLEGVVKLADFGVSAKCSGADAKRSSFVGTPYWMAPEVIACETGDDSPYNFTADIWSFGITIIEFAQIDPPYSKMNPARVAIKILHSDPPTLDKPKKWSSDLNDFISKCLQKEPSNRLLMSQLLQHAFLRNVENNLPIMQLISEVKADVTIELCDVDSREDLSSLSNSNSAEEIVAPSSVNLPTSESDTGGESHDYSGIVQSPDGASSDVGFDREAEHYRSLTKTRSYVYEGNLITRRTSKIIAPGDENKQQEEHQTRKANFRALKLLQFTENRRLEVLNQRFLVEKDTMERQFETELKESLRRYSADCEQLAKSHKQTTERLETKHSGQRQNFSRSLKEQHGKDLRVFKDSLKRELRTSKRESNGVPRNIQRRQLEQKEVEFVETERKFREQLGEMSTQAFERLSAKHRNEMAALESELLQEKHQLLRAYEVELWNFEEKQLEQKSEFQRLQIEQLFDLHKELATVRYSQELEQLKRSHDEDLVKLRQKIAIDGKEAAKRQKIEIRREQQNLKERLKTMSYSSEQEREALKELEESTRKKIHEETERQNAESKQAFDSFEREYAANISEMKQLLNERLESLDEQARMKLHDEDERHKSELKEWHSALNSRKQILEEELLCQTAEHQRFYQQGASPRGSSGSLLSLPAPVQQTASSWMNSDNHISTAL